LFAKEFNWAMKRSIPSNLNFLQWLFLTAIHGKARHDKG
jgi:hypothetical protein